MSLPLTALVVLAIPIGIACAARALRSRRSETKAVVDQHLHLLRGGTLNRNAIDAARRELEDKLDSGNVREVDELMRPGLEFVVQARALAEIGTDAATCVLERQLGRTLARDPLERAWYRLDAIRALRTIDNDDSLPAALEVAGTAIAEPLGHLFAAEVASFSGFPGYLDESQSPLGQAALRVLRVAMRTLRSPTPPAILIGSDILAEAVNRLVRSCPDHADPFVARVFLEVLRNRRRTQMASSATADEPSRRHAARRQAASILAAEPVVREYLHDIGADLIRLLPDHSPHEQAEIFAVLHDLRSDATAAFLPMLLSGAPIPLQACSCLRWSPHERVRDYLCMRAEAFLANRRGLMRVRRIWTADARSERSAVREIVTALRGHPSVQAERVLCRFALAKDAALCAAALSSLGWWEPVFRSEVVACLRHHRDAAQADVRWAAVSGLARLGEREALQELRSRLADSNCTRIREALERIAGEGLTLLWPELDRLTEHDDATVAALAWDALDQMREDVFGPLG